MTPDMLASLIIKFCDVKQQSELFGNSEKSACVFFLLNCSVDKGGLIRDTQFENCKGTFIKNKKKIMKEYGG